MRSRTRNEKRIDDAKRGGGSAGADQARREARADAANLARQREKGPARYVFVYKVKVKNNGTTAITAIDWDYIFLERGTQNEVGRQQFTSEEQIGSGKTRELTVTLKTPPTHTVSVTSLNLSEHEQLTTKSFWFAFNIPMAASGRHNDSLIRLGLNKAGPAIPRFHPTRRTSAR